MLNRAGARLLAFDLNWTEVKVLRTLAALKGKLK
jgi:hypothetical protein